MQYSDDSLPRIKITRTGTDGASKNFSVLDISKAPAEADLSRADFLICYNNLLEFFTAIGCGSRTLQGLNEHLHAMLSDPNFTMWFEAYKAFDRDFRAKFFKDPFIPDPLTKSWSDGVQTAKDNYLLNQRETQYAGEQGLFRRGRNNGGFGAKRFTPYESSQHDGSGRTNSFRPLCLKCGSIGHRADSCSSTTPSKSGRSFLVEWRDGVLVHISDRKLVCVRFNLTVCKFESSPYHGIHICSLCTDTHHGATKCTRN
ncbi:hypothetical protein IW262DRAFT_1269342 [Armillaria fumosa]|nr:hypothetical protein IW262DRAFT_1269342 [Armillaria fumosa]